MSADNYVLVRKEDKHQQWVGYMQSASIEEDNYDEQLFCTSFLEDAIILAQEQDTEYGYLFELAGLYSQSSSPSDTYFPSVCKHCGNIQKKASTKEINMDGLHGTEFLNYDDTS